MKKHLFLSIILSMVFILTFGTMAFAEEMSTPIFSDDTIITDDNIYEVVEVLGLDASAVGEKDETIEPVTMTVGELRELIDKANDPVIIQTEEWCISSETRAAGVTTVGATHSQSTFNIYVEIKANFYKDSTIKYWTGVQSISLSVSPNGSANVTKAVFANTPTKGVAVFNANTSQSVLNYTFDATVNTYANVSFIPVQIGSQRVEAEGNIYPSAIK